MKRELNEKEKAQQLVNRFDEFKTSTERALITIQETILVSDDYKEQVYLEGVKQEILNIQKIRKNETPFHAPSYISGLKSAIEQIETEWDMCVMEYDNLSDDESIKSNLKFTKKAFEALTGLIEDEMIQYGEVFPRNFYCDKIRNLEDKPNWYIQKK